MALNLCTGRTEAAFDNPSERQWNAFGAAEYAGAGRGKHVTLGLWLLSIIPLVGLLVIAPTVGSTSAGSVDSEAIEARRAFAQIAVQSKATASAPNELSSVMSDLPDGNLVRGATVRYIDSSDNPRMFRQLDRPARASRLPAGSMLMISTGDTRADRPAPGTAFSDSETDFDRAWLEIELAPEPHASILYLSYNFLTAEGPAFAAGGFNDRLVIEIRDRQARRNLATLDALDPKLKPVSHVDSMDTGFALFSDDPSEFPASYGIGQPVAAMSGWRTAVVAIDARGPVTIRIELRDEGDSLMDSAVVIGQIVTTPVLHPSLVEGARGPDCLTADQWCDTLFPPGELSGPLQEFPPRICSAFFDDVRMSGADLRIPRTLRGITQPGAVADGATRWPLGFGLFNDDGPWHEAELSLPAMQVPEDGGLGQFGSFDRLPSVTVPVVQLGPRDWAASAQYFVPENYWHPGLTESDFGPSRPLIGQACFRNTTTGQERCFNNAGFPFAIVRPQAVLMHGLWSDQTIWEADESAFVQEDFPLLNLAELATIRGDYSANSNNARSFEENRRRAQQPLRAACLSLLNQSSVFGARHDYIGHSMGGLLGRLYLEDAPFRTINRLITMNTPHLGSPLANLLIQARDDTNFLIGQLVTWGMEQLDRPINLGAIDDLAVGSDAILAMQATPVPAHALIGVGGTQWADENLQDAPGEEGAIYRLVRFLFDPFQVFGADQHDLVVSRPSQAGRIGASAQTVFQGLLSIHSLAPLNPEYSDRLFCPPGVTSTQCTGALGEGLLNLDSSIAEFSQFPAPASAGMRVPGTRGALPVAASRGSISLTEDGVQFTAPADGAIFASGDTVQVSLAGANGFNPTRVLLLAQDQVLVDDQAPFDFQFEIPLGVAGAVPLAAIAEDVGGGFARTEGIVTIAEPAATLEQVGIVNGAMFLNGLFDRQRLAVIGEFSDGISRDLTDPSTGTVYTSADPEIASVNELGAVSPHRDGGTVLMATNGGLQDSIPVEVDNIGDLIFFDGFE